MNKVRISALLLSVILTATSASAQVVRGVADGPPTPPADTSFGLPPAAPVAPASPDASDEFSYFSPAAATTSSGSVATSCDCNQGCSSCQINKRAAGAYKPLFYNNDFSYLCDPCYNDWHLGENLKQIGVGCNGCLDIGGQFRLRFHHEDGMKGQRFREVTDDFALGRLRLYADYHMNDWFRFYIEGIHAESYDENQPVRPIDVNSGDLLNAFFDVNLLDSTTVRVGRQELLYGAQRTVSPLDWANTRRTFEGIKVMHDTCDWSIDGFFTNYVPVQAYEFDEADYDQPFYGVYSSYKGYCNATIDLYYLGYDDHNAAFSYHTFGSRLNGNQGDWLYEVEGAYQAGDAAGIGTGSQSEGFVTAGIGRKMPCRCWKPSLWVYFDYASENYNQLFPLAHKYLGFIDAVQRSNVISPNVLLKAHPTDRLTLLAWYYHFQSATDAPIPAIGGTPPQNTGRHYGDEIDLTANYKINARNDLLIGYSHFWKGNKITNTNDADFVYAQWMVNF